MEKLYTKEQLVKAMKKYNQNYLEDESSFDSINETNECAENQVEYLLSFVEEE
jgi:hypothetical protein